MYHSKVVVISWAVVFVAAALVALMKKRWQGLSMILAGAALTAAGIAISAWLNHPVGAVILSAALLGAALTTLLGIAKVFQRTSD